MSSDLSGENKFSNLKVAILHYWLVTDRGGEKVLKNILELFPKADIYTLFYDEEACGHIVKGHQVYVSTLNKPFIRRHYQVLFPFYPFAIRSLELREKYDLLISSESGPIKGIANPDNVAHLCYIHTPMRYCWGYAHEYLKNIPTGLKGIFRYLFNRLRHYDKTTVDQVDLYIANSRNVANRVKKYYGREAKVCYPPIDKVLFKESHLQRRSEDVQVREYYLSFGAITPYKRIDLLIDAFQDGGRKLIIIGAGSEYKKLKSYESEDIVFKGSLAWSEIETYILNAKALLFPGEEDFGMIPLEVMAHGVPVIAYKKGGALETVVENFKNPQQSTGLFFEEQSKSSILKAIKKFENSEYQFSPEWIQNHAKKFNTDCFKSEFKTILSEFVVEKKLA